MSLATITRSAGMEEIKAEVAKMPLKIGLSQFGLTNHLKPFTDETCYNNESQVLGEFSALDRAKIAGTSQTLVCTDCHAAFSDVPIPIDFH